MNNKLDLGKGDIKKLLFTFSIPCIISMLVNSIYNLVDQIFIGQGVGYLGNAATNVIFPLVVIFTGLSQLIGNGGAAFLSLNLGEKNYAKSKKGVGTSIFTLIVSSIFFSALAYILLPNLINWFGCTENVYSYALDYGRIIVLGLPFMVIYTGLSAIIRADGSPKFSMISIMIGAILNIILDPIFIFDWGLGLGIKGGALATILGQFVSCMITCVYLFRFKSIKLKLKDLKMSKTIFHVLGCGLSSFITQVTVVAIFIVMNNVMTIYGAKSIYGSDIPLSVFGVVSKLNQIFISVIVGLSCGAQPIVGYNYGAGDYNRVRETMKKVIMTGVAIGLFFTIIFVGFPRQAVSIFGSSDNELYLEFATKCCRIYLATSALNIIQISTGIMLQALGKVVKSAFTSVSRQILLFVPLVLIMSFYYGLDGSLWAAVISDILAFIISSSLLIYEYKSLKKCDNKMSAALENKSKSNGLITDKNIASNNM